MSYSITVFTPTYNRRETLNKLYLSLIKQSFKDFEWLVVDDGSLDDTKSLINQYKNEGILNIQYYYQKNSGKHIAINRGLDLAKGEWFFIVDSDDYLVSDSLSILNSYITNIPVFVQGIVARKAYQDFSVIGDQFKQDYFISDHIEKKYIKKLNGDLAEVFKTEVMKDYKFPEFEGQKFCAESLMWNRIAKNNKSLFVNDIIYIAEYLDDGLSANSIKNRRKSPDYAMLIYKELSEDFRLGIRMKARTYINYWRFSFFSNNSFYKNWMNINKNFLALLLLPLGFFMMLLDNRKIIKK